MGIYLRRAKSGDAEFLAWVTLAASRSHLARGLWDVIIGADEAGCLDYLRRLAIAEPRSLYHWSSYVVAEINGERAAALCGFEPRDGGWAIAGEAISNVQRDLGWTDAQAAASYQRVAPVWATCMPPDAGADIVVENVATRPAYRRRGLADILLDVITRDAIRRGCHSDQRRSRVFDWSSLRPQARWFRYVQHSCLLQRAGPSSRSNIPSRDY